MEFKQTAFAKPDVKHNTKLQTKGEKEGWKIKETKY